MVYVLWNIITKTILTKTILYVLLSTLYKIIRKDLYVTFANIKLIIFNPWYDYMNSTVNNPYELGFCNFNLQDTSSYSYPVAGLLCLF